MTFEHAVWLAMAFAFGWFSAISTGIYKNSKQIRRNSESIRQRYQAETEAMRGSR